MRPVLSVDLICAGRAVMKARSEDRESVATALIAAADLADNHRRRFGVVHPEFGSGTLADAARLSGMAPEPTVCRREFAEALACVLQTIIRAQAGNHRVSS